MRNNMRAERYRLGLSAEEVAEKIGVHSNSVLAWERGEAEPRAWNIIDLSKLYRCDPEYLLDMTDEREPRERPL